MLYVYRLLNVGLSSAFFTSHLGWLNWIFLDDTRLTLNASSEKLELASHLIHLLFIGESFQNCRFYQHRCYHSNKVMTHPFHKSPIFSKSRPQLLK